MGKWLVYYLPYIIKSDRLLRYCLENVLLSKILKLSILKIIRFHTSALDCIIWDETIVTELIWLEKWRIPEDYLFGSCLNIEPKIIDIKCLEEKTRKSKLYQTGLCIFCSQLFYFCGTFSHKLILIYRNYFPRFHQTTLRCQILDELKKLLILK